MTGMQAFVFSSLVERFGQTSVLITGLLCMGFGPVFLMFKFTAVSLLAVVSLYAFVASLSVSGVTTIISRNSSSETIGRDMGWMDAAVSFGQTTGPIFGVGSLISRFISPIYSYH